VNPQLRAMKMKTAAVALILFAAFAPTALAQEVLLRHDLTFKGTIGRTGKESKPDFPKPIEAPRGAPNVLVILTDDVGFGASSTFGGPIRTPTMDRLPKCGLRYNQFHTTALCSPTRAALLSGSCCWKAATRTPCSTAPAARFRGQS
jgi:hypothetical protein